jgi:hypothetical protein
VIRPLEPEGGPVSALQPLDPHPASPDTLIGSSSSLATQASSALALDASMRQAYSPVPAHWSGVGEAEAYRTAQLVSAEAVEVSGSVAGAAVAVAYWAKCVQDFNDEVARIVSDLSTATFGPAARALSPEDAAAVRAAARRRAEARWHTAYDTHIVTGRAKVAQILREGPGEELILELFQLGLLPMAVVNLYPTVDFGRTDWHILFANLRSHGVDPLSWATVGSYDPAALRVRLDLMRRMGVPPSQYRNLLQIYWVSVAAEKAGIDLSQWDPGRGARELTDIIQAVYTYYGNLFLANPYLQWAGMANMIGPSFAAGFYDLALFRRLAGALEHQPGVPYDMSALAHISDEELRFFETTFLGMQKNIFYDQAMMHEAYLAGGTDAIHELQLAGLIDPRTEQAWDWIDEGRATGNSSLIESGNTALLRREQQDIIDADYQRMYDHPVVGPPFTYLMTAVGEPSIPGAQSFADYRPLWVTIESPGPERIPLVGWDNPLQVEVNIRTPLPDGNIAHFDDRWTYITEDTLPAYQELLREDPQRAREIIASDVGERIDDYRIYHRLDSLLWHYATDWGVDVDQ